MDMELVAPVVLQQWWWKSHCNVEEIGGIKNGSVYTYHGGSAKEEAEQPKYLLYMG